MIDYDQGTFLVIRVVLGEGNGPAAKRAKQRGDRRCTSFIDSFSVSHRIPRLLFILLYGWMRGGIEALTRGCVETGPHIYDLLG